MKKNLSLIALTCLSFVTFFCHAKDQNELCTNNAARSWWDVQYYSIKVEADTATGYLSGQVNITAIVKGRIGDSLQIDLQEPMKITSISTFGYDQETEDLGFSKNGNSYPVAEKPESRVGAAGKALRFVKYGNAYYVVGDVESMVRDNVIRLNIQFEGIPQIAVRPPWDGGIVLDRDTNGTRWMGMACQGIGASVWFPCKDFQGDEADKGMQLKMTVPEGLSVVSNGRCLVENMRSDPGKVYWTWGVSNPINNYDISFYIGDYTHWSDTLNGAKGKLDLEFWVLKQNLAKAKKQFEVVKPMLHCFEEKMGPYPFYEDGYKLVDAPYLGMEHQSAIAYGNGYRMGYKGVDRSATGEGLKFDFIIIHESGHEWFGNNITTYDKADTWVHEGFTSYTETIFAECLSGKEAAFKYQSGKRRTLHNDKPVQGFFGNCDEGSGDHYDKAGYMIHMIRLIMKDDEKFFAMLREMNRHFYHKIVTGNQVKEFMNNYPGRNFDRVYEQYLQSTQIPKLEIVKKKNNFSYRWKKCVPDFDMPVRVIADGKMLWLYPETEWKINPGKVRTIEVDKNFLVD